MPAIIWLCLRFSTICSSEISQNFYNLWKLSSWSFNQYLIMRRLLNLSPSGNLSHCVFFSFDLFFRRKPMNITGEVCGNPGFHHKKNCIVLNCFQHTFSGNDHAIVSRCYVCFACWHLKSLCYVRSQILCRQKSLWSLLNPLIPKSDNFLISPYNITPE